MVFFSLLGPLLSPDEKSGGAVVSTDVHSTSPKRGRGTARSLMSSSERKRQDLMAERPRMNVVESFMRERKSVDRERTRCEEPATRPRSSSISSPSPSPSPSGGPPAFLAPPLVSREASFAKHFVQLRFETFVSMLHGGGQMIFPPGGFSLWPSSLPSFPLLLACLTPTP